VTEPWNLEFLMIQDSILVCSPDPRIPHTAYFRRAYRMSIESFWELHEQLRDGIDAAASFFQRRRLTNPNTNYRRPPVPNGKILSSVCLGCALRYFGGGSPYDLMVNYGISHTEVLSSVWMVVKAVNKHAPLFIEYPANHENRRRLHLLFTMTDLPVSILAQGPLMAY
jgi:hypothetical protein